jgi:hypothetical protein
MRQNRNSAPYATAPGKNCPVNRVEQLAVLPEGAVSEPFGGGRYEVHSGEA